MNKPFRIVVGFDGSDSSRRALERALGLAGYGSRLTVVHVTPSFGDPEPGRRLLAEAERKLAEEHANGDVVERTGNPADELIAAADQAHADLLVVGNGKTALQRLFLGSVSSALIHRAPCDVLVAR